MSLGTIGLLAFCVFIPIGFLIFAAGKTRALWIGCLAGMFAVLGGCEAYSKFIDPAHLTLSQRFYELNPVAAWAIAGLMAFGWIGLLVHLITGNVAKHKQDAPK